MDNQRLDAAAPATLEVELPGGGSVPTRVAPSGNGEIAVIYGSDPAAVAVIDRALDALARTRRAA